MKSAGPVFITILYVSVIIGVPITDIWQTLTITGIGVFIALLLGSSIANDIEKK